MWTVDTNCSRCKHKTECKDRLVLIKGLSDLASKANNNDGLGDGRIVISCQDFKPE